MIVFVGPGVGHLTNLVLPGEGIFESFFARRGDGFDCRLGRKRVRPNICFHIIAALKGTCIFGDAATFINKDCRVLFGDIFIVPFLGPALGWTAMCSPGWGNLVAIDWKDLPVGRQLDGKLNIADLKVFTLDFASENSGAVTKLFTLQSRASACKRQTIFGTKSS